MKYGRVFVIIILRFDWRYLGFSWRKRAETYVRTVIVIVTVIVMYAGNSNSSSKERVRGRVSMRMIMIREIEEGIVNSKY